MCDTLGFVGHNQGFHHPLTVSSPSLIYHKRLLFITILASCMLTKSTAVRTTAPCAGFFLRTSRNRSCALLDVRHTDPLLQSASSSVLRLQPTVTLMCPTRILKAQDVMHLATTDPTSLPCTSHSFARSLHAIHSSLTSSPCAAPLSAAFLYFSFGSLHANHRPDL